MKIPLGADKAHGYKSEALLIQTYCKKQFFQQFRLITSILRVPGLGSDHCRHSPWHRGEKVEESGGGEGTPDSLDDILHAFNRCRIFFEKAAFIRLYTFSMGFKSELCPGQEESSSMPFS